MKTVSNAYEVLRTLGAKYIDSRNGEKKSGAQLSSGRNNRRVPYRNENSLRMYRQEKVSKGRRSIRTQHYQLRPGDPVTYNNEKFKVKAVNGGGKQVMLSNGKNPSIGKVTLIKHTNGWEENVSAIKQ